MTVAVVPDARVRALNRSYRGTDRATDVLSFPSSSPSPFLGDIVIARGVARLTPRHASRDDDVAEERGG